MRVSAFLPLARRASSALGTVMMGFLVSCGGKGVYDQPQAAPTIASFTAGKTNLTEGASVTFTWTVSNAARLELVPSRGEAIDVTGLTSRTVQVYFTTTFILKATNSSGQSVVSQPIMVTISKPIPLPGGEVLELVPIPAGSFSMGSPDTEQHRNADEGPLHQVELSAFYIGRFETTQAQWVALMRSNPSWNTVNRGVATADDLRRPVEFVSFSDITGAGGFLERLNASTASSRPAGMVFRLPTEAEWECAARGGTQTRFPWGNDPKYVDGDAYAWWSHTSTRVSQPVGEKLPNPFGLHDMAGNVFEWCQDWYATYPGTPQKDPVGPRTGYRRVVRGGDYTSNTPCRSASRGAGEFEIAYSFVGFRVVLGTPREP